MHVYLEASSCMRLVNVGCMYYQLCLRGKWAISWVSIYNGIWHAGVELHELECRFLNTQISHQVLYCFLCNIYSLMDFVRHIKIEKSFISLIGNGIWHARVDCIVANNCQTDAWV